MAIPSIKADVAFGAPRSRTKRTLLTSVTGMLAKSITVATSLATIPATQRYLGDEQFGLWMTILSFAALLAFADLGLGNGLLTALSRLHGRDDVLGIRRVVSNAVALLAGLALFASTTLVVLAYAIDWTKVFRLTRISRDDLQTALVVFAACFAGGLVTSVVQRIQQGLQMGTSLAITTAAGALLSLGFVLLAVRQSSGLAWLIGAMLLGPIIAGMVAGAWLFGRQRPDLRPEASDIEMSLMSSLVHGGALFFVLQVTGALSFSSDNSIAARALGAAAVSDYAIAAKLFGTVSLAISIMLMPLWPAYGEALARGETAWVRATLKRSMGAALVLSTLSSIALVVLFDWIVGIWLHRQITISTPLMTGLALWVVVGSSGSSLAMFLNGANIVKAQIVIAIVFSLACFACKLLTIRLYGTASLPWVTTICYLILVCIPYYFLIGSTLRARPDNKSAAVRNSVSESFYG